MPNLPTQYHRPWILINFESIILTWPYSELSHWKDGNAAFTSGNHELAITLYTEAMKYARVHETLSEGETMAIAAANRWVTSLPLEWLKEHLLYLHYLQGILN